MDRIANGRALRSSVPRSSHGELFLSRSRSDPLLVLQAQNATRIKELVPVRMARMLASPFAFMRGSAAIMAGDLANSPRTNLQVMACGDMHLLNFGLFASAERNLVFAINDFDEVLPALWEWDLKRLAASAAVAAQFMAGDRVDAEHAARAVVEAHIARMRGYAEMDFLEVWYDLIDEKTILASAPPRMRKLAQNTFKKARGRGHIRALDRLTEEVNGEHRILEDVPLIVRAKHLPDGTPVTEALTSMLRSYLESLPEDRRRLLSRFRVVDVARKVVGVGSVGTNCWVVLLEEHGAGSPLFLQIKEAQESVLAQFLDGAREVKQQGRRVVVGQRMIQGSPDVFLGWGPVDASKTKRHYYVRQLADMKGGLSLAEGDRKTRDGLPDYCRLCGWALALAHAKSGDAAMISGYCGTGDVLPDAIGKYALAYLEQTERDYGVLKTAARNGKVSVAKQR
ncbi:DUF2252 domain-containing protein [Bradyrhizobium sp. RT6a]|uniref:DUF2252 domain-containing protein n=1 Tax=Bradyrhizobium sp. RT6a TaxID=3156381 RepID=UPI0033990BBC